MPDFSQFRFHPASLAAPRKPGISALLRVKNGEQFVRLAIESHLPFYDEIIACHNGCTDNTVAILLRLQQQHPGKIKVHHYLPKVHSIATPQHRQTPADSVHSMANYCNYALSKTTRSIAVKLDDDHLAIPCNLAPAVAAIRADMAAGKTKLYFFSGLNLIRARGRIMVGGRANYPFSGQGDIVYFPVSADTCYRQGARTEKFVKPPLKQTAHVHLGLLYFHLHYLKRERERERQFIDAVDGIHHEKHGGEFIAMRFEVFRSEPHYKRLVKQMKPRDRIRLQLHRFMQRSPKFRVARMLRLRDDLRRIDFERDALDWLR
ncbi:MAG: hypothetical protein OXU98_01995 [Gammaproteobacteria bacterium]|nr:hypothetical protein [Gammaproteobacteria bacterium]